jgi:hypothetical protein
MVSQTWVHQAGQWRLAGIQFSPMEQRTGDAEHAAAAASRRETY